MMLEIRICGGSDHTARSCLCGMPPLYKVLPALCFSECPMRFLRAVPDNAHLPDIGLTYTIYVYFRASFFFVLFLPTSFLSVSRWSAIRLSLQEIWCLLCLDGARSCGGLLIRLYNVWYAVDERLSIHYSIAMTNGPSFFVNEPRSCWPVLSKFSIVHFFVYF